MYPPNLVRTSQFYHFIETLPGAPRGTGRTRFTCFKGSFGEAEQRSDRIPQKRIVKYKDTSPFLSNFTL